MSEDKTVQWEAMVDYAQAHQLEEQAWNIANMLQAFDSPGYIKHKEVLTARKANAILAYKAAGGLVIDRILTANIEDLNAYALSENVKARFGNQVNCDSDELEGNFFIEFPTAMEADIIAFFEHLFPGTPTKDYEIRDAECELPNLTVWNDSKAFLRHAGIKRERGDFSSIVPERSDIDRATFVSKAVVELLRTGMSDEEILRDVQAHLNIHRESLKHGGHTHIAQFANGSTT